MTHNFVKGFLSPGTQCKYCKLFIWMVPKKGYHCTECKITVHSKCRTMVEHIPCVLKIVKKASRPSPVKPLLSHDSFRTIRREISRKSHRETIREKMEGIEFFPNEKTELKIERIQFSLSGDIEYTEGTLWITNYRLLISYVSERLDAIYESPLVIPLPSIASILSFPEAKYKRIVSCHDFRTITLIFDTTEPINIMQEAHTKVSQIITDRFTRNNFSRIYDYSKDIKRRGFSEDELMKFLCVSDFNKNFLISKILPSSVLTIKGCDLRESVKFRNNGRFPVYCWADGTINAFLFRCERPRPSLNSQLESSDIEFIEQLWFFANEPKIFDHEKDKLLRCFDTGAESLLLGPYKEYCHIEYFNLPTKELLGSSIGKLQKCCHKAVPNLTFLSSLHNTTGWRNIIYNYLSKADIISKTLNKGNVVVLLQSGGDHYTTGILEGLVQIILDPYCRTIDGFCNIIEKDWVIYGYPFAENKKNGSGCVQFFTFIHCVYEIYCQFQNQFEFTADLLQFFLESLYDIRFVDFIFNNEYERLPYMDSSVSVFYYVKNSRNLFQNQYYDPSILDNFLRVNSNNIALWYQYLLRWNVSIESDILKVQRRLDVCDNTDIKLSIENLFWLPSMSHLESLNSLTITGGLMGDIGNELGCLTNLKKLALMDNTLLFQINSVVSNALTSLTSLTLHKNKMSHFSHNSLYKLKELIISENYFEEIPQQFSILTNLQKFSLTYNHISSIPSFFLKLSSLEILNLSSNRLSYLPSKLVKTLTMIKSLNLAKNNLSRIPDLHYMPKLEELILYNNKLEKLPESLCQCTSLVILKVQRNVLKELPANIGNLDNLQQIDFSNNKLLEIPPSLGNCISLNTLKGNDNVITDIPATLWKCCSIQVLQMGKNKLKELSPGIGNLRNLNELKLNNNDLTSLPATMGGLSVLTTLDILNNNLKFPAPSVISTGTTRIIEFLREHLHGEAQTYRMRLMVVGPENVGKTTLTQYICSCWNIDSTPAEESSTESQEETPRRASLTQIAKKAKLRLSLPKNSNSSNISTNGIDVTSCRFPLLEKNLKKEKKEEAKKIWSNSGKHSKNKIKKKYATVHVWDFAGQDIYHTTHQFFLSRRSVYLVVFKLNIQNGVLDPAMEKKVIFWIESIKSQIKNPSIILVGTHLDMHMNNRSQVSEASANLEKRLSSLFSLNISVHVVSCSGNRENLDNLCNAIQDLICSRKEMGEIIPRSYEIMECMLTEMREQISPPIINRSRLLSTAGMCGLKEDVYKCTRILHEWGVIVYFDKDEQLKDLCILDPHWLITMLATLFTTSHNFGENYGILKDTDLRQIWKQYPEDIHGQLLYLLEKFEIALRMSNEVLGALASQGIIPRTLSSPRNLPPVRSVVKKEIVGCLIPALFPVDRPTHKISEAWPSLRKLNPQPVQVDRIYRFVFLADGIFSRLLARIFFKYETFVLAVWKNGILARIEHPEGLVLIEHLPVTNKEARNYTSEVHVRIRSPNRDICHLEFGNIIDLVNSFILTFKRLEWDVIATRILKERHQKYLKTFTRENQRQKQIRKPLEISLNSIVQSVLSNEEHVISGTETHDIADIAPDLSLKLISAKRINYKDLSCAEELGSGAFSTVYKGFLGGENVVAIKKLNIVDINDNSQKKNYEILKKFAEFRYEVTIQSVVSGHSNITGLLGICLNPICIISEFATHGTLHSFIHNREKHFPWNLKIKIALDIANGLFYMHNRSPPLAHLDMKSPNVLLVSLKYSDVICAKIADFGTSVFIDTPQTKRFVDNPVWLAPEIIKRIPYDQSVDTYAFGVILWEIVTRNAFFGEVSWFSVIEDWVVAGKRPDISPKYCPKEYKKIIESCWHQDPKCRPNWEWTISRLNKLKSSAPKLEQKYGSIMNRIDDKEFPKEQKQKQQQQPQQPRSRRSSVSEDTCSSIPPSPRSLSQIQVQTPLLNSSCNIEKFGRKGRSKTAPRSSLPPLAATAAMNIIAAAASSTTTPREESLVSSLQSLSPPSAEVSRRLFKTNDEEQDVAVQKRKVRLRKEGLEADQSKKGRKKKRALSKPRNHTSDSLTSLSSEHLTTSAPVIIPPLRIPNQHSVSSFAVPVTPPVTPKNIPKNHSMGEF